MGKMGFIIAGIVSLIFAALSSQPTEAASFSGGFAPVVDTSVTPVTGRCWHRPNGRLVCAHRPYGHYHNYYEPYGYYPAYRYGYYHSYYWPYYYGPYYAGPYSYYGPAFYYRGWLVGP